MKFVRNSSILCISPSTALQNNYLRPANTGKIFLYIFAKLIRLFNRLKEEFQKENPNLYHLSNFEYQIDSDYEKLKRELGYPTDSFIDFFKRLNFLDKVIYATTFLFSIVGIYAFTNCVLLFLKNDIANAISALSVSFILFIGAYLTSYPGRH